jgi:hypothetical protein
MRFANTTKHRCAAGAVRPFEMLEDRVLFASFVVNNANDSGAGSLRQAILSANKTVGKDTVTFAIGSGAKTIAPLTALPTITDPLTLDATTQPGYAGKPLIELSGANLASTNNTTGLVVTAGASTVKGFVINRFGGNGISLLSRGGNTVCGNYIGTNSAGTAAAANKGQGILVQTPGNVIGGTTAAGRNVISGNAKNGIQLYTTAASGNQIRGNYVGTNAAGTAGIGNGKIGVSVGSGDNTIGGPARSYRNVISANATDGILIAGTGASGNKVQGNYIGTDAAGTAAIGNLLYGVEISQPNNTVGGQTAAERNVISGNAKSGVVLYLASATGNKVQGNYIGTDATGKKDLGNRGRGVDITHSPSGNLIGGTTAGARNVISGNDGGGIGIYTGASKNTVSGNFIGTDASGLLAVANGAAGVSVTSAAGTGNVIGGTTAAHRNVISGNAGDGVRVGDVSGTRVQNNYIGAATTVSTRLPNKLFAVSLIGGTNTTVLNNTLVHTGATPYQLISTSGNVFSANVLTPVPV